MPACLHAGLSSGKYTFTSNRNLLVMRLPEPSLVFSACPAYSTTEPLVCDFRTLIDQAIGPVCKGKKCSGTFKKAANAT